MKLDASAEYIPDGDIIIVNLYVLAGTKAKPNTIVSGTCEHVHGDVVYATAEFSRVNGNTDGPVKIAFNHPAATFGSIRAHVVTDTETLDAVFPIHAAPVATVAVAGNEF